MIMIEQMVKFLLEGSGYLPCPECQGDMFNYPKGTDGSQTRFRGSIQCHSCGHTMSGMGHKKEESNGN